MQRQVEFDCVHQDLYVILYSVTDKTAAFLVAIRAYDERRTRGDGQKVMKELEEKYVRVTNEIIRALHAALPATSMEPDENADYYAGYTSPQSTRRGQGTCHRSPLH